MSNLKERVLRLVLESPGLTDREITDRLIGSAAGQQPVNQAARTLAAAGLVGRWPRPDGKLGNFAGSEPPPATPPATPPPDTSLLCEDDVKRGVAAWLQADGWHTDVKWGRERGIDIDASREGERWVIEAKGCGSRQAMRVNYFLAILGETLQRMDDSSARYSIALPDMPQYRGLWSRLPALAKSRTRITLLLVGSRGNIEEVQ